MYLDVGSELESESESFGSHRKTQRTAAAAALKVSKMCSRKIKISVMLFLVLIPIFTALPHNHNLSKRSNFFDLECKGIFNKTMFFRLDRICEDCYQLFRETSIHRLCKQDCFGSPFFNACIEALQLHEEMDQYNEWRETLGRK
ncbi:CHH-like protein isoform X2 [Drosophila tropicalis]|uniref:CHH-like protein isoform X2 n=1 Tax=Drosophila tropicalis TaxID=46794 RepID=UPI0035ABE256